MSMQYFTVPDGDAEPGGDQAVMVPYNAKALAPNEPERTRRLRKHLVQSLRALRTMKDPVGNASALHPAPEGFAGKVTRTACTMCRGYCCKGGGEHAYLDERVMARVRQARPELDARAVMRLYLPPAMTAPAFSMASTAARWTVRSAPASATCITATCWAGSLTTPTRPPVPSSCQAKVTSAACHRC
jgi:hypothetical protein